MRRHRGGAEYPPRGRPRISDLHRGRRAGRCGFNAAGIAITANYLQSDRDYRQVGVPLALIRRKVLESEHLALAMRAVYCTGEIRVQQHDRQPGRDGVAIDFECAPDETFRCIRRRPSGPRQSFREPGGAGQAADTGIADTP